jgi:hypothetical protein
MGPTTVPRSRMSWVIGGRATRDLVEAQRRLIPRPAHPCPLRPMILFLPPDPRDGPSLIDVTDGPRVRPGLISENGLTNDYIYL